MSLLPAKHNYKIWQGATFREVITVYTDSTGTVHRDLTGASALLEIRAHAKDVTPLFTLSTGNGRITLGGSAGTVNLFISSTDTAALTWTLGHYDLTVTASSGDTDPLLYGSFAVLGV